MSTKKWQIVGSPKWFINIFAKIYKNIRAPENVVLAVKSALWHINKYIQQTEPTKWILPGLIHVREYNERVEIAVTDLVIVLTLSDRPQNYRVHGLAVFIAKGTGLMEYSPRKCGREPMIILECGYIGLYENNILVRKVACGYSAEVAANKKRRALQEKRKQPRVESEEEIAAPEPILALPFSFELCPIDADALAAEPRITMNAIWNGAQDTGLRRYNNTTMYVTPRIFLHASNLTGE